MAEFYFHFFDGEQWSKDSAGIELASAEDAYIEAVAGAREMWPELLASRCNPTRCAFEITDRDGSPLFRVEFAELLENCRDSGPGPSQTSEQLHRVLEETNLRACVAREELRASFETVRNSLAEANDLLVQLRRFDPPPPKSIATPDLRQ
jgi:hypothetical protein